MKITCQACQSKYTIADEKIQGKVAKIRCRKCGATVLVDASVASSNGSVAPSGAPPGAWLVNVAEGDERTMQIHEVIDAYNTGVITGETYLWKEGMGDWLPLSEMSEIVDALNQAGAAAAAPQENSRAPVQAYRPPSERAPSAAKRGAGDMFARGNNEDEVATSVPPHVLAQSSAFGGGGGATGQLVSQRSGAMLGTRDEQSVLFSLNALTGAAAKTSSPPAAPVGSARGEDSGLIDLNALAKAQSPRTGDEPSPLQIAAPSPFMFPAALGTVEAPPSASQKKSTMPLFIGGGVAVAALAIGVAIFAGGKKEEIPPLPAEAALSAAPVAVPTAPPAVTAAPVAATDPATADSSGPAKVKRAVSSGRPATKAAAPTTPVVAAPATPLPPPKPKSPCGCSASDLNCQIRCSATGH